IGLARVPAHAADADDERGIGDNTAADIQAAISAATANRLRQDTGPPGAMRADGAAFGNIHVDGSRITAFAAESANADQDAVGAAAARLASTRLAADVDTRTDIDTACAPTAADRLSDQAIRAPTRVGGSAAILVHG